MIIRNAYSARPPRGQPGQGFSPLFPDRANSHTATGRHSPVGSQRGNRIGNDFADEPRVVAVDLNRSGMPRLYLFVPFHGGSYGDQAVQRIAR